MHEYIEDTFINGVGPETTEVELKKEDSRGTAKNVNRRGPTVALKHPRSVHIPIGALQRVNYAESANEEEPMAPRNHNGKSIISCSGTVTHTKG